MEELIANGLAWVIKDGKEVYSSSVAFGKKKLYKTKEEFIEALKREDLKPDSEIEECHMRWTKEYSDDFGEGYYKVCNKGRGTFEVWFCSCVDVEEELFI